MNREILFRGKRVDNGEWVCGYPFPGIGQFDSEKWFVTEIQGHGNASCSNTYRVDPSTVCQFTGLTDKNGVKIFEGDIIEAQTQDTKRLRNAEVRFGEFADINSDEDECYIGFYIVFDGIFTTAGQLKECSNSIEVIGNIFDNPELLEENNT